MSADARREFVDANILVYAFDASAGEKHTLAAELLARLWENGGGCLSVQVLQEFFAVITRKVPKPLSADEAVDRIRDFGAWDVFAPTIDDVLSAIALHTKAGLSFWDAMIVEAAAESGCEVLWSEDLSHGQRLRGVDIQNPFRAETRLR